MVEPDQKCHSPLKTQGRPWRRSDLGPYSDRGKILYNYPDVGSRGAADGSALIERAA